MHEQESELHKKMISLDSFGSDWFKNSSCQRNLWGTEPAHADGQTADPTVCPSLGWSMWHFFLHPTETLLRKHSSKLQVWTEKQFKAKTLIKSPVSPPLPLRATLSLSSPPNAEEFNFQKSTFLYPAAPRLRGSVGLTVSKTHRTTQKLLFGGMLCRQTLKSIHSQCWCTGLL